ASPQCPHLSPHLSSWLGAVHAIALHGATLFIGGDFSSAGGIPTSNLAAYRSGVWSSPGGLNRPVYSLARIRACLYIGGAFTKTVPSGASVPPSASGASGAGVSSPGGVAALYAARLCDGGGVEPVASFAGVGPVRVWVSAE
ncbi:hypothetical protein T484DRAFT_1769270, partial [Baffinella frigidus]